MPQIVGDYEHDVRPFLGRGGLVNSRHQCYGERRDQESHSHGAQRLTTVTVICDGYCFE
jgi:hypothetical protein